VERDAVGPEELADPLEDRDEELGPLLLGSGVFRLQLLGDLLLELQEPRPRADRVEKVLRPEGVLRPGLQLARRKRFREVVVRERLEPLEEVLLVGPGGHEEDLRVRRFREGLDPAADLVPGEVVHLHVEEDDVRGALSHLRQRLRARERELEVAVELFGDVGGDLRLKGIVVDEEDERAG